MVAEPHINGAHLTPHHGAWAPPAPAAEAATPVDLNCVCRARAAATVGRVLRMGIAAWVSRLLPLFPLARPPATDCAPLEPAAAGDSAEEAESLRRCIADADNRRVRSAAPLILGRGAAALRALCRALRRHESSALRRLQQYRGRRSQNYRTMPCRCGRAAAGAARAATSALLATALAHARCGGSLRVGHRRLLAAVGRGGAP